MIRLGKLKFEISRFRLLLQLVLKLYYFFIEVITLIFGLEKRERKNRFLAKLTKVHSTMPSIHCVSFKAEKLITHQQSESSRLQVVASATAKIPQLWT